MSYSRIESDIREYYENRLRDGKVVSESSRGAREITIDERSLVENRPKVVIDNTFDLTPEDYRSRCLLLEFRLDRTAFSLQTTSF